MKHLNCCLNAILALAVAAAGLVAARVPAHADVIILDVSGTMQRSNTGASCATTGCTLGGTITIDNSPGAANGGFVSADVTTTGFSPDPGSFGPLLLLVKHTGSTVGNTELELGSTSDLLDLRFNTPMDGSFVDYTDGGPIISGGIQAGTGDDWTLITGTGSLTPVPAPSIGCGLPALLAMGGLLFGAKLLERDKRRRLIPTAA